MYFPPVGLCLPFLTFIHGDGVTTAGGVSSPPHCVLLLYRFALTPFVEQFCQSGGSWDRRFNRILDTWNSFSTHLPKTLKFNKMQWQTMFLNLQKGFEACNNKQKFKIKHSFLTFYFTFKGGMKFSFVKIQILFHTTRWSLFNWWNSS